MAALEARAGLKARLPPVPHLRYDHRLVGATEVTEDAAGRHDGRADEGSLLSAFAVTGSYEGEDAVVVCEDGTLSSVPSTAALDIDLALRRLAAGSEQVAATPTGPFYTPLSPEGVLLMMLAFIDQPVVEGEAPEIFTQPDELDGDPAGGTKDVQFELQHPRGPHGLFRRIHELGEDLREVAHVVEEQAREREVVVSPLLQRIAADLGGHLEYFDQRLKKPNSIISKLNRYKDKYPNKTPSQRARYLDDALRYTIVFPHEEISTGLERLRQVLASEGFDLEVEIHTGEHAEYKGINCTAIDGDGYRFEIQVHSPESFAAKAAAYKYYNRMREITENQVELRLKLWQAMRDLQRKVPLFPPDVERHGTVVYHDPPEFVKAALE